MDYDNDFSGDFHNDTVDSDFSDRTDSGEFYGGIPMGDSTLYLTDDDDICAEFADEFQAVNYDYGHLQKSTKLSFQRLPASFTPL